MIDTISALYLASAYPLEGGAMHKKQAGRYEVVKELPKESHDVSSMFDYARVEGNLRLLYLYNKLPIKNNDAVAIGGTFGFTTASYHGINLHVKATTSQNIRALNDSSSHLDLAYDLFDENGDSFTYLSHLNVHYQMHEFGATVGRFMIDTPYADSDDIRMAANTFEGGYVTYERDHLEMRGYYLSRWAGYDSGADQNEFKRLTEDGFGLVGASLEYKFDEQNIASLWYYYIDEMSSIGYAEYAGHYTMTQDLHVEYGVQGSYIAELADSTVQGSVVGAMAIVDYGPIFAGVSYNYGLLNDGEMITDGFGGGPYYTSLDEATIGAISEAAVGEDVEAYRIGLGCEFQSSDLVFEAVFGELKSSRNTVHIDEVDLVMSYAINDDWNVEATLMHYNSKHHDEDFQRALLKMDYEF
jgi:hypothetical protein